MGPLAVEELPASCAQASPISAGIQAACELQVVSFHASEGAVTGSVVGLHGVGGAWRWSLLSLVVTSAAFHISTASVCARF